MERFYFTVKPYLGRIVLTLLGFTAGILFLTLGFWKIILLIVITAISYTLGRWKDGVWNPQKLSALPDSIRNIHL